MVFVMCVNDSKFPVFMTIGSALIIWRVAKAKGLEPKVALEILHPRVMLPLILKVMPRDVGEFWEQLPQPQASLKVSRVILPGG